MAGGLVPSGFGGGGGGGGNTLNFQQINAEFNQFNTEINNNVLAVVDASKNLTRYNITINEAAEAAAEGADKTSAWALKFRDGMAAITAVFNAFTTAVHVGVGAIRGNVASFVEAFDPAAMNEFNFVVRDLYAVIGTILRPVLADFTKMLRTLADYLLNTSPQMKDFIAQMVKLGTILVALIPVVAGLTLAALFWKEALIALSVEQLLAGQKGEFLRGQLARLGESFVETAGVVWTAFKGVIDGFRPLFETVMQVLNPVIDLVLAVVEMAAKLIEVVAKLIGVGWKMVQIPLEPVLALFGKIMEVVTGFVTMITAMLQSFVSAIDEVAAYLDGIIKRIRAALPDWLKPEEKPAKPGDEKSSFGLGVMAVQTGSAESFAMRQYAAAYQLGADDPTKRTADNTAKIAGWTERMFQLISEHVNRGGWSPGTAGAGGSAGGGW